MAAAISGLSALGYEVAWTRLLALVIGPTTYAFATMTASFITGLAIGSAVGTRLASRTTRPGTWLGAALIFGGAAAVAAAWYGATAMPLTVAAQAADPSASFDALVWRQALAVAVLMLPMTFTLGATFPLALAVAGGDRESLPAASSGPSVSRAAAGVYAANTLGAIGGALVAGFVLVPAFGLEATIRSAAVAAVVAGVMVLARTGRGVASPGARRYLAPAAAAAVALAVILAMPRWDRTLLASGAYKYAPYLGAGDLEWVLRAGRLAYYREGAAATVSVKDLGGTRSLAIDGKVDASNAGDMLTQRLLGLLPVALHGRARDIAIIGLGSGVTVGSALAPGTVSRADVIEISPEVVDASRFFDRENGAALSKPGVRLIVGDGRSHLLLTPRRYDVIVSEPSNPWMAGVASLFTREFFEAARARLNDGGLLCQWAHTYDISTADLRSIVRTFSSVFPSGTMWLVGGGDLLLIGARDGEVTPKIAALNARATLPVLRDVGVADGTAPVALMSLFAGGPAEVAAFGAGGLVQTDDRTALEFSAPRAIYGQTREDNGAAIRSLGGKSPPSVRDRLALATDADWTSRGTMDLRAQAFPTAYEAFKRAVTLNPRNAAALAGLSDAAGGSGHLADERDWLRSIASREPGNTAVRIELSRVLAVTGDVPGAVQAATEALQLAPDDERAAVQLASVFADAGDAGRLGPFAEALARRFPASIDGAFYQATAMFLSGRPEEAAAATRRIVDAHPEHGRSQALLGAACASLNRRDCAVAAFDAAIRANPRDPTGYVNAGAFSLQVGNAAAALDYFATALAIDPSTAAARQGLAQARRHPAGR
jgi:spermidine synthase